jgi:hypothetical protein
VPPEVTVRTLGQVTRCQGGTRDSGFGTRDSGLGIRDSDAVASAFRRKAKGAREHPALETGAGPYAIVLAVSPTGDSSVISSLMGARAVRRLRAISRSAGETPESSRTET